MDRKPCVIGCKAKILDAKLHLLQILLDMGIGLDFALLGQVIAALVWLLLEEILAIVILPHGLGANAHLCHDFDTITQHGPGILVNTALHSPLVVVDEEPAGSEILEASMLLHIHLVEREVERSCQGVGSAASQMSCSK